MHTVKCLRKLDMNIPWEQWLYNTQNEIEDEIHFLHKCMKYDHMRTQLLNENGQISIQTLLSLMSYALSIMYKI